MNKVSLFVKETISRLKGDDTSVIAIKNYRKAEAALKSQVANLEAAVVDQESTVENAEDALANAKFPVNLITDNTSYLRGIKNAQESLDAAKSVLSNTKDNITYFKTVLADFQKEVTA